MTRLRRAAPLLAALLLLGLAAAFALLAVDVRAWQARLRHDDVRFTDGRLEQIHHLIEVLIAHIAPFAGFTIGA